MDLVQVRRYTYSIAIGVVQKLRLGLHPVTSRDVLFVVVVVVFFLFMTTFDAVVLAPLGART